MAERPSLDPERQNRAKEFSRQGRRLALLEMALGTAYLLAWTVSGSGAVVADALEAILLGGWPLQLAAMIGSLAVPWLLVTLPLGYYGGFLLPHRFGQS